MAIIDYKIVNLSHDNRHVALDIRIYRGVFEDVTTYNRETAQSETVNRYVRKAKLAERHYEYDVLQDSTRDGFLRKARAYLNNKLIEWASAHGHSVITEQQDITDLEPVINEI